LTRVYPTGPMVCLLNSTARIPLQR
jgi:hypothetical protein